MWWLQAGDRGTFPERFRFDAGRRRPRRKEQQPVGKWRRREPEARLGDGVRDDAGLARLLDSRHRVDAAILGDPRVVLEAPLDEEPARRSRSGPAPGLTTPRAVPAAPRRCRGHQRPDAVRDSSKLVTSTSSSSISVVAATKPVVAAASTESVAGVSATAAVTVVRSAASGSARATASSRGAAFFESETKQTRAHQQRAARATYRRRRRRESYQ